MEKTGEKKVKELSLDEQLAKRDKEQTELFMHEYEELCAKHNRKLSPMITLGIAGIVPNLEIIRIK